MKILKRRSSFSSFLKAGRVLPRSPEWLQTHWDPFALASTVLGLKICATIFGFFVCCCCCFKQCMHTVCIHIQVDNTHTHKIKMYLKIIVVVWMRMPPQVHIFEYLVPSCWNYLGRIRRYDFQEGVSLVEGSLLCGYGSQSKLSTVPSLCHYEF